MEDTNSNRSRKYLSRFKTFLSKYSITKEDKNKGCEFTHTTIPGKSIFGGSYNIPKHAMDDFYTFYFKCLKYGHILHLTEKHEEIGPIVIDIDLKFHIEDIDRKYTSKNIKDFIEIYRNEINKYLETGNNYDVFVMEKNKPSISNINIKDGIHIIIPSLVSKCDVQFVIRKNVLKILQERKFFDSMNPKNKYDDIVDKAVIKRNNWQMYGSCKPNNQTYKLTRIFNIDNENNTINEISVSKYKVNNGLTEKMFPKFFSIRGKTEITLINEDKEDEIKAWNDNKNKYRKKTKPHIINQTAYIPNIENIRQLVKILSIERSNDYKKWIEVGFCLHNIHRGLLSVWVEFSKKSSKFVSEDDCEKRWRRFRNDGLGIGTLFHWAKKDSPENYEEMRKNDLRKYIIASTSKTHVDVAKVVYQLYKDDYRCIKQKKDNIWYEYYNHKWNLISDGTSLRLKLSNELVNEYCKEAANINLHVIDRPEDEKELYIKKAKLLNDVSLELKKSPFKNHIMRECADIFYDKDFEEKLDSNPDLLGFENGVYDFKMMIFRDGRPEDYISMSTNIDYIDDDDQDIETINEVNDFLYQILPIENTREYFLKIIASCLHGDVPDETFHILTGTGSNGKSKLLELIQQTFGDYATTIPITLLTSKRNKSNQASPEVAQCRGVRFAILQEPDGQAEINVGLMKELTGGDKISCRKLYGNQFSFKPMMKFMLVCNHLPKINSNDGGTWRRIRLIEFISKFKNNPNSDKLYEFKKDKHLQNKFTYWKETFMSMLIEQYKIYMKDGAIEPDEVLKPTLQYQKTSDIFLEFKEEHIQIEEDSFISLTDLYTYYKIWFKESHPGERCSNKGMFKEHMIKKLGVMKKKGKKKGWYNYNIINEEEEEEENLLD